MLSVLFVRNVVLIDKTEVHFGNGLNVLSGETGAGKSILLAALGLALGYRADRNLLRQDCEEGEVSAVFNLAQDGRDGLGRKVGDLLEHYGIRDGFQVDGEVILRRSIHQSGKSRAFVNDRPVNISVLHELAGLLMEVQGHFEQQGLLATSNHREFLDNFADTQTLLAEYQKHHHEYRDMQQKIQDMRQSQHYRDEEAAYLQAQVSELEGPNGSGEAGLDIADDEEARLDTQRKRLKNSEHLIHIGQTLAEDMQSDNGLEARLQKHIKALETADFTDDNTEKALLSLQAALSSAMDGAAYLQASLDFLQGGEETLEAVESRLFHLRSLARKHQCQVNELPHKLKALQTKLSELQNIQENISATVAQFEKTRQACLQTAESLSAHRRTAAAELDKAVMAILPRLKLEKARFVTELQTAEELRSDGMDKIGFMVQSNPGGALAPIGKVASAGELSRFLLALRSALATKEDSRPQVGLKIGSQLDLQVGSSGGKSLVFDEVDSGIGGATAHAVGQKLSHLARHRQVILITHSAQAAAFADRHFFVGKAQNSDSTRTSIDKLDRQERTQEIARMLSGDSITEAALAQANSLISAAGA